MSGFEELFLPFKVQEGIHDFGMVVDMFAGHRNPAFREVVDDKGGEFFLIPGGCTGLVQPLDCTIMSAFKAKVRRQWKAWKADHTEANGDCPRISRIEFVGIVSRAWDAVSPDAVRTSWRAAGLVILPDDRIEDYVQEEDDDDDDDIQFEDIADI